MIARLEALSEEAGLSLLAILQGLTEFLPVSSSGHLVLTQAALEEVDTPALAVDVALHLGTLAAVLVVYRRDLFGLLRGLGQGRWREPLLLALGTLPAAIVGLTLREDIHGLFERPRAAALGLVGTGLILLVGEWARRRRAGGGEPGPEGEPGEPGPPPVAAALAMGIAQALAILPGVSRSGTTIACGLVFGLSPRASARFSFLLAVPAILGAAAVELPDAVGDPAAPDLPVLLWAVALAGFVGWGALRVLLAFLGRGAFAWFAVYCGVLGLGLLAFL